MLKNICVVRGARVLFMLLAVVVWLGAAGRASASFHFMQIEQIIGGVNGDVTKQAIQLRMRAGGQTLVGNGRLISYDSAGLNPILLINIPSNVTNGLAGDRVLFCSANFPPTTTPTMVPNFTLTELIPADRLAAGRVCFQDDFGTIYWSVAYGGSAYTGTNLGNPVNCNVLQGANGNFGAPFAGPLPSTGVQALRFTRNATDRANANATDYAVTAGPAVWTNNQRNSFTMIEMTGACCQSGGTCSIVTQPACAAAGGTYQGDATACSSCPLPMGACCLPGLECTVVTADSCASMGGTYQGNNTACASCPQPIGACCTVGFTCSILSASECGAQGGTFQGDGTTCEVCPQPPPEGACCLPPGNPHGEPCHVTTEDDCVVDGGTYRGDNTECASAECPIEPPACPCDWNQQDGLDSQDLFDFYEGFFSGDADFNGVDGTDSQDLFDFYECFFAPPEGCAA